MRDRLREGVSCIQRVSLTGLSCTFPAGRLSNAPPAVQRVVVESDERGIDDRECRNARRRRATVPLSPPPLLSSRRNYSRIEALLPRRRERSSRERVRARKGGGQSIETAIDGARESRSDAVNFSFRGEVHFASTVSRLITHSESSRNSL